MPFAASFREIISGRRQDWGSKLSRQVLSLAEPVYRSIINGRNRRFDRGRQVHRVAVPVISVGNLTTGGTGKTPLVAWIARYLQELQLEVGLISRGYRARPGMPNDEALELEILLPGIPHLQNPDRVAASRQAVQEWKREVLVLDDAFQHRRLHRDLDIVLIDALEPFGFEHLLPRGLLREPLSSLNRAHVVAISRADLVSDGERARIRDRVRESAAGILIVELAHRAECLLRHDGVTSELSSLKGHRVAAFCGIGNPSAFRETLLRSGAEIGEFREYSDHFAFEPEDVRELDAWANRLNVERVVCTLKDLVKVRREMLGSIPLHALKIGIEFQSGQCEFEAMLESIVRRRA